MIETDQQIDMSKPHWRSARASDLMAISAIAARIHPDLPESPDVFAEKMRLYPDGCRVLIADDEIMRLRTGASLEAAPDSAAQPLPRTVAR